MDYRIAIESSVDCFLSSNDIGRERLADAMGMTE